MVGFVSPAPPQRRDAWTALMPIEGRCFFIFSLATTPNILKNQALFSPKHPHIGTNHVPLKQNQTECKNCTNQSVKIALIVVCKYLIIYVLCMEWLTSMCSTYIMLIKPRIITKDYIVVLMGLRSFTIKTSSSNSPLFDRRSLT